MSSLTPLLLDDVDGVQWDDLADVVVVGLGAAGVTAAIEARERGADVVLLDRFEASEDATVRGRVLAALGNAEGPVLSERALDLAIDERLRVNEISRVLGAKALVEVARDSLPPMGIMTWLVLEKQG